jgi:hypothetical protein
VEEEEEWVEIGGMAMGAKFARNDSRNACGDEVVWNDEAAAAAAAAAAVGADAAVGDGRAGVGTAMTTGLGGSERPCAVAPNGMGEDGVIDDDVDNEAKRDAAETVGREVVVVVVVVEVLLPLEREENVNVVGGGAAERRMGEGTVLLLLEEGVAVAFGWVGRPERIYGGCGDEAARNGGRLPREADDEEEEEEEEEEEAAAATVVDDIANDDGVLVLVLPAVQCTGDGARVNKVVIGTGE